MESNSEKMEPRSCAFLIKENKTGRWLGLTRSLYDACPMIKEIKTGILYAGQDWKFWREKLTPPSPPNLTVVDIAEQKLTRK